MSILEEKYFDKFYTQKPEDVYEDTPALKKISIIVSPGIVQAAHLKKTDRVLSLGCGSGRFELKFAPQVREVVGVDISKVAIKRARQSAKKLKHKNVAFLIGDITQKLPFPDASFDKILAIAILHHLLKPEAALKEISRLLKKDGIFCTLDPNAHGVLRRLGQTFLGKTYRAHHSPDEHDLDYKELQRLCQRLGFEIEKLDFWDFLVSPVALVWPKLPLSLLDLFIVFDKLWCKTPLLKTLSSSFILIGKKTR